MKDEEMTKYGVDESELEMEKTAGRETKKKSDSKLPQKDDKSEATRKSLQNMKVRKSATYSNEA